MDAAAVTFGLKDVVIICGGLLSIAGTFFGLKSAVNGLKSRLANTEKTLANTEKVLSEKIMHERNSKKSYIQTSMDTIQEVREEMKEKERQFNAQIKEVRQEHKDANSELNKKMDDVRVQLTGISTNLATLTGYMTGKKERDKN